MKEIILYGAGGHCFAIIELIKSLQNYKPSCILDDAPKRNHILDIPVVKSLENIKDKAIVISVGNNFSRKQIAQKLKNTCDFPILIHKSTIKYASAQIGEGVQILPGVVLDAAIEIGDFCIINNHATISHNVKIGDFCHIAIQVALSGGVTIGEGTLIGAGSVVLPEIKIGKWAIIGAGAVVTKDVPDFAVVYGNPARIIKYNNLPSLHEK